MPIIRLPDALRDAVTSALGNDLSRRIENGRAVAILTYQFNETGEHEYVLEFKRAENTKTLGSFHGQSDNANGTKWVPLVPKLTNRMEALAENIDIGDGVFKLRHIPSADENPHDFRIVWTPSASSAVYLALEAKAEVGQSVVMKRGDLYPGRD